MPLTEKIEARVDKNTKAQLAVEMKRQQRSEGAIVRLALKDYLSRKRVVR